jgi:hypothetical protein
MVHLKDSKDPIQGISKLDLIIIMSRSQVVLPSFQDQMQQGLSYKKLNEEQQQKLLEKLKSFSRSNSSN